MKKHWLDVYKSTQDPTVLDRISHFHVHDLKDHIYDSGLLYTDSINIHLAERLHKLDEPAKVFWYAASYILNNRKDAEYYDELFQKASDSLGLQEFFDFWIQRTYQPNMSVSKRLEFIKRCNAHHIEKFFQLRNSIDWSQHYDQSMLLWLSSTNENTRMQALQEKGASDFLLSEKTAAYIYHDADLRHSYVAHLQNMLFQEVDDYHCVRSL